MGDSYLAAFEWRLEKKGMSSLVVTCMLQTLMNIATWIQWC